MGFNSSKSPISLDIKFDNQNQESQVKDHALTKYQENSYLLGKIFAVNTQEGAHSSENESDFDSGESDEEMEEGEEEESTAAGDEDTKML